MKRENDYSACFYLPNKSGYKEESDDRMVVVGKQGGKDVSVESGILTVFDCATDKFLKNPLVYNDEQHADELGTDLFRITNFTLVTTPQYLVKNLVLGTNRGSLRVVNLPEGRTDDLSAERFMKPGFIHQTLFAHAGEITKTACSFDGRFLFSAGKDGVLFVYKIKELNCDLQMKPGMSKSKSVVKKATDPKAGSDTIVRGIMNVAPEEQLKAQPEMADIVLVSKTKMEKWLKD